MKNTDFLDAIGIASPCQADWDDMHGTDRVRHCDDCQLNVYNLSEMTREDATRLVEQTEGRLCVRFHRRDDGTVLTRDCPTGLAALRRRARLAYARVAALVSILVAGALGCTRRADSRGQGNPAVVGQMMGEPTIMGDICVTPPSPTQPPPTQPSPTQPQSIKLQGIERPPALLGRVCPPVLRPRENAEPRKEMGEIQRSPTGR